jgi:hypothetical protein
MEWRFFDHHEIAGSCPFLATVKGKELGSKIS